jgi:hypothetical protein
MSSSAPSIVVLVLFALVPIVFVAVGVLLVISARRNRRRVQEEYQTFAKRVGGSLRMENDPLGFSQPREVRFKHGKTSCSLWVDVELVGGGGGEHPGRAFHMRMSFDLDRATTFVCHITPQWLPKILAGVLRTSDVRLGWDEFDRRFVVTTNDELRSPDILHRPVQEQLFALSQVAVTMLPQEQGHVALAVTGRLLDIRMRGLLDEAEQLYPFYLVCGRLFDVLSPRLP